jgi:hypothetical protein
MIEGEEGQPGIEISPGFWINILARVAQSNLIRTLLSYWLFCAAETRP